MEPVGNFKITEGQSYMTNHGSQATVSIVLNDIFTATIIKDHPTGDITRRCTFRLTDKTAHGKTHDSEKLKIVAPWPQETQVPEDDDMRDVKVGQIEEHLDVIEPKHEIKIGQIYRYTGHGSDPGTNKIVTVTNIRQSELNDDRIYIYWTSCDHNYLCHNFDMERWFTSDATENLPYTLMRDVTYTEADMNEWKYRQSATTQSGDLIVKGEIYRFNSPDESHSFDMKVIGFSTIDDDLILVNWQKTNSIDTTSDSEDGRFYSTHINEFTKDPSKINQLKFASIAHTNRVFIKDGKRAVYNLEHNFPNGEEFMVKEGQIYEYELTSQRKLLFEVAAIVQTNLSANVRIQSLGDASEMTFDFKQFAPVNNAISTRYVLFADDKQSQKVIDFQRGSITEKQNVENKNGYRIRIGDIYKDRSNQKLKEVTRIQTIDDRDYIGLSDLGSQVTEEYISDDQFDLYDAVYTLVSDDEDSPEVSDHQNPILDHVSNSKNFDIVKGEIYKEKSSSKFFEVTGFKKLTDGTSAVMMRGLDEDRLIAYSVESFGFLGQDKDVSFVAQNKNHHRVRNYSKQEPESEQTSETSAQIVYPEPKHVSVSKHLKSSPKDTLINSAILTLVGASAFWFLS